MSKSLISRFYIIGVIVFSLANITSCSKTHVASINLNQLKIDVTEGVLKVSKDDFVYDEHGHFGEKVQYDSTHAGKYQGVYSVHCRGGKAFGIEVKFPDKVVERSYAVELMQSLIAGVAGKQIEHDDEDIRKHDSNSPAEFFYFDNGVRAEITYSSSTAEYVSQLSIWRNI